MATIYIYELSQGTVTGYNGMFDIPNITPGSFRVRISYVGYETSDTVLTIAGEKRLSFFLSPLSLKLKEVSVSAREHKQSSTASSIGQSAIEHLQPSSMTDVLQLLPGNLLADSKLNTANQVSMRQAGTDANTALGTAVVMDGVPLSNDYNTQSFYGASSSETGGSKSSVNGGVDLRRLSTDHVQEVEVIRGIPSVKYGDLTSGAIVVKSKKGETPLTFRVKSDPLNKLLYAGKGFRLPGKAGVLNVGLDYTRFVADQRSPFDTYNRITSNLNYERLFGKNFLSSFQLAYTGTLDKQISDPDVMNKEDRYSADYNNLRFVNTGAWNIGSSLFYKLEYTLSVSYAHDVLSRTKTVTLNSPMGITDRATDGESIGIFLPSEYLSSYTVDGKPFNLYNQVIVSMRPRIGKTFNNLTLGEEVRIDKNLGNGSVYDRSRPPYPTLSSSGRERAAKDIPAMQKITFFAEDDFRTSLGRGKLTVVAGVRATTLMNLSADKAMHGKVYVEPRTNISYLFPAIKAGDENLKLSVKAGLGDQVKFPTALQLYPEKAYFDIAQLNYYSTSNTDNRLVYLLTSVKDPANSKLTPARNRKLEAGFDIDYGKLSLSVTAFRENGTNGFEQQTLYFPQKYKLYDTNSFSGQGKPSVEDFSYAGKAMFLGYSTTTNAATIIKQGVEYQLSTGKVKAISTEIVVNGAWFRTEYDISMPRYKYPNIVLNNDFYPYVGIFNAGNNARVNQQLNTNLFLNTHLSRLRLMFSTVVQTVWYTSYRMNRYSGVPDAYIDLNGQVHPFTEAEMQKAEFKPLIETFSSAYFNAERTPVSLELNLKATKEIGDNFRLSFFVNRLLDYNPRYTTRFGVETRKWTTPFMGAELQLKF